MPPNTPQSHPLPPYVTTTLHMASFLPNLTTLVSLSLSVVFLAIAAFIWYRYSHIPKTIATDVEKGSINVKVSDKPATKYTWEEIRGVTSSFSAKVIAHGGYSSVYLTDTTPSFAVKVHNGSKRLHAAFLRELDVLLHVRHANIVRLLGFSDHDDQGALVFEYIPNGTLHERLHGGVLPLPWAHRMRIALQLAMALEYLHEGCDLQIVHNDVKPSNILLDEKLNCKLCDFGSAKLGFSSTVDRIETKIVGTIGYVDPYYVRTGVMTSKSDVYSFGAVVLEMVSGRGAICEDTGEALVKAMQVALQEAAEGKVEEMVDTRLEGEFNGDEVAIVATMVERCVEEEPSRRPSMREVVRMLKEKVNGSIANVGWASKDKDKSTNV